MQYVIVETLTSLVLSGSILSMEPFGHLYVPSVSETYLKKSCLVICGTATSTCWLFLFFSIIYNLFVSLIHSSDCLMMRNSVLLQNVLFLSTSETFFKKQAIMLLLLLHHYLDFLILTCNYNFTTSTRKVCRVILFNILDDKLHIRSFCISSIRIHCCT